MTSLILYGSILASLLALAFGATCGQTEYFQYKFTPKSIRPVNADDEKSGKERCGEGRCDFIVMLYGEPRCKDNGHAVKFTGPVNKNTVERGEFTPDHTGYTTHAQWRLSDAKSTTFGIEVCDEDGFPRGRNDAIMQISSNRLEPGCHSVKHQDDHPEHPYIFEYEVCCKPVDERKPEVTPRGTKSRDSSSSGRSRNSGSGHRYNLRSRESTTRSSFSWF